MQLCDYGCGGCSCTVLYGEKKKTEIREQCGEIIDWGDTQQRPSVLQRELEVQGKDTQLSLYFIQSGIVLCLTTN